MGTPPQLVDFQQTSWAGSGTPKSLTLTLQDGDTLIAVGHSENGGATLAAPTGGTGITWTLLAEQTSNTNCTGTHLWKGTVVGAQSVTLSVARGGSTIYWGWEVWQYRGSAGVGASAIEPHTSGTSDGQIDLTTTGDNSAIVVGVGDWMAASGTGRVWDSVNGAAPVEDTYYQDGVHYAVYAGHYADAGAAGLKTVGLSAPTGLRPVIVAVEILGQSTGSTPNAGTGTATLGLSATGAGSTTHAGTGTGGMSLGASGSGSTAKSGSGTASLSLTGTGSGTAPPNSGTGVAGLSLTSSGTGSTGHSGTGSAGLDLTATGTGSRAAHGTGDAQLTLASTASGSAAHSGSGTGILTLAASGTGTAAHRGTGSATLDLTASGTGRAPAPGVNSGTGTAALTASSTGTGSRPSSGTGAPTLTVSGTGDGHFAASGTGVATLDLTASGTGHLAARGTGSAQLALTGTGVGRNGSTTPRDLTIVEATAPAPVWATTSPELGAWAATPPVSGWSWTEPTDHWTCTEPEG